MDIFLEQFLPYLRCPVTMQPLSPLSNAQLDELNERIQRSDLRHADGNPVSKLLTEALISKDQQYAYAIIDGQIAVLLESLAIVVGAMYTAGTTLDKEKKIVLDFYNEFGWKKADSNLFKDTVTFEDRRSIAARYWSRCHLRLNRYLPNGQYILDVASGAIPNDEYITYGDNFQVRICMDFSLLAVQEAAKKLNGQGVFILGDMTNIPMTDACLSAIISMHTVYHIPESEQTQAIAEAYRALKPGGKAVIVYSWKDAPLMYWSMRGWRTLLHTIKRRKRRIGISGTVVASRPQLFIYQQSYRWFARSIRRPFHAQLKVYSAISRSFSATFIREKAFGKYFSRLIYRLEDWLPGFFGRYGQYPVFVLNKPVSENNNPAL